MKTNLIKKLALTLALTTTIAVSAGCEKVTIGDRRNLTTLLSSDVKIDLSDTIYCFPENSKNDYYVSIIGHYDSNNMTNHYKNIRNTGSYDNHNDYRITYKVSKQDYETIANMGAPSLYAYMHESDKEKDIKAVENIIKNNDPIEIKKLEVDKTYHEEKPFDESWRFNEEEYLSSLQN